MTSAASAVVTATLADIPDSTVAGGSVSVTVASYVTTLLPVDEPELTGEIPVTVPRTVVEIALTVAVAAWLSLRLEMLLSVKLAVTCRALPWTLIA